MRKRANKAMWGWIAGHQEELDALYDKLVKLRHGIGKNWAMTTSSPWPMPGWGAPTGRRRMPGSTGTRSSSTVPLAQKLYKEQAQRIGIEDMKSYDYALMFLSGNPTPRGGRISGEAGRRHVPRAVPRDR